MEPTLMTPTDGTLPAPEKHEHVFYRRARDQRVGSVGMPAYLKLQEFGSQILFAFGEVPYQVGSSLSKKAWRDVDVRVILDDDEYKRMGLGEPEREYENGKWVSLVLAYSALGKEMTGLPIDFQIQQRTHANKKFPGSRNALAFVPLRVK